MQGAVSCRTPDEVCNVLLLKTSPDNWDFLKEYNPIRSRHSLESVLGIRLHIDENVKTEAILMH